MDNLKQRNNDLTAIDVNYPGFYNQLQDEIDSDLARMKKSIEVVRNLRMTAAEMEVETAATYHAELWRDIEELKILTKDISAMDCAHNSNEN
ncbi:hypothetical protein evm_003012 [Chilo suppressalis]|nr:hypothetical protein evm_003012 [Chilo suppressalis]